jgi:organic radical activating enzyme
VSEFFCDSIQGEGVNAGVPAAFLRLKGCVLDCTWCDTTEVWRQGNPYTFAELFCLMDVCGLPNKLLHGQHLVLTGGSPLCQQMSVLNFINEFIKRYSFCPYIEIENECTIKPMDELVHYISCWNNSPKLSNSGNDVDVCYKPAILETLAALNNSWFKFVITSQKEWDEIDCLYLSTGIIQREQIILMPQGSTKEDIEANREMVIEMAIKHEVRYCTREHIIVWGKKIGI